MKYEPPRLSLAESLVVSDQGCRHAGREEGGGGARHECAGGDLGDVGSPLGRKVAKGKEGSN